MTDLGFLPRWWARLRERAAAGEILAAAAADEAEEREAAVGRVLRESRLTGNAPNRRYGAPPWNRGRVSTPPEDPALRQARIAVLVARGRRLIAAMPPEQTTLLTLLVDALERNGGVAPGDERQR